MQFIVLLAALLLITTAMTGVGMAADTTPSGGGSEEIVKGDVLLKEGDEYVIKDVSGHEVRVHVGSDTKKDGVIKIGDKVEATVTREGHATSIRQLLPQ